MDKNSKIKFISIIIVVGFIFSVVHYALLKLNGFNETIFDFLLSPNGRFDDFKLNYNCCIAGNNPYKVSISHYSQFPFIYRFGSIFNLFPVQLSVLIFITLFISFFLYYCFKNVFVGNWRSAVSVIFIFSFLTYPFLFSLNRANYEVIVFLLIALFIFYYTKNRMLLSILFLSSAIAMKPFPAVLIVILLADKKYKEIAYTLLIVSVLTICSYLSFKGDLYSNVTQHMDALHKYNADYAIGNAGLGYGNSLFGAIKIFIALIYPDGYKMIINKIFSLYTLLSFIVFGLISLYIILIKSELWKRVTLLILCMNLLPHVSADYKLINLFVPIFLFINAKEKYVYDMHYCIIFGLLLIPKSYYFFAFDPSLEIIPYAAHSSVILNPVIMVTGLLLIIVSGIKDWIGLRITISH